MKVEFLGTGTSYGVPQIGCSCEVCLSKNKRDNRTRCSIWVQHKNLNIIVDTGPDFRFQCLRSRIPSLNAVLFTHFHADHVFGIDDIRQFNTLQNQEIPVYVPDFMIKSFRNCFGYTLSLPGAGLNRPRLLLNSVSNNEISLDTLKIQPVDVCHGEERVKGYVFRDKTAKLSYLVDCKTLPQETIKKVTHSDIIVLSALWKEKISHPSHLNLDEAIHLSSKLKAKKTYLTHLTHKIGLHLETSKLLPHTINLAYDGMVL